LELQGQDLEETSPYPEVDLIKKGFDLPKMEKPYHL
jgi:hypothetical protein